MKCEETFINLENDIIGNNMATSNVFEDIGVQLQAGKRQDLFWIALAIMASGVLIAISLFGKKKRRRR